MGFRQAHPDIIEFVKIKNNRSKGLGLKGVLTQT